MTRCHECPGLQEFVELTRQYSDKLRGLDLEQLQELKAEWEQTVVE